MSISSPFSDFQNSFKFTLSGKFATKQLISSDESQTLKVSLHHAISFYFFSIKIVPFESTATADQASTH